MPTPKMPKMRNVSTTYQEKYQTEDGNVTVTNFKRGLWQVMPRGKAPFTVGSKGEAFRQAAGISSRHWGMPKSEAFPRGRSHATKGRDLSTVDDALGYRPEPRVIARAEEQYGGYSTNELRREIRSLEDEFEMSGGRGVGLADRLDAARIALALRGGGAKRSHATKKAGLSAEQRAEIDAALGAYGARLTDDDRIAKGEKVMSVQIEGKGGRLKMVGGGNVLASYPASRAGQGVSDFVEKFWFWKKGASAPGAGHARRKSPAQLDREIGQALARRSHATAGNPFDVEIGDAVQFRWEPQTGGVVRRSLPDEAEGRRWVEVATSKGPRKVPIDALRRVRPEHEARVRRSVEK